MGGPQQSRAKATPAGKRPPGSPRPAITLSAPRARGAIAAAVVILASCTLLAALRLGSPADDTRTNAQARAQMLAAEADADLAHLRAGAHAGAAALTADPARPLDAAEAAVRAAGLPGAAAVVVAGGEVVARTGAAGGPEWVSAIRSAGPAPSATILDGAPAKPGAPRWTAALVRATAEHTVGVAVDLSGLARDGRALFDAEGRSVAGDGRPLPTRLGLTYAQAQAAAESGVPAGGWAMARHGSVLAATPLAEQPESRAGRLVAALAVLGPAGVGGLLVILLLRQMRQTAQADEATRESERRFRMAVEAARCGIWEWDLRADRVFMSDVTAAMLGWGGGGVADGAEVIARVAPEHRERLRQALEAASQYGAFDASFAVPRPGGDLAWIDARGQSPEARDGRGYATLIGVALDVTEERAAQLRVQAAENRLQDAINCATEAFVLWDRRGRLVLCNRAYREFFMLEARLLKPGASRQTVERIAALAIKAERPAQTPGGVRETELADGRWVQIAERRTADGGRVMTATDVTALKRQQVQLRRNERALKDAVARLEASQDELTELAGKYHDAKVRAEQANSAKSEFLANMSHELRTPLNAIIGFSEMMKDAMFGPLGNPRYDGYARDIHGSGQHLLALINDILDMSKIEAGKLTLRLERLDLAEMIDDAARLVRARAEAGGLSLRLDLPPGLPEVEADERALKQVLLNLLSNAVKFTPAGGSVTVSARPERDGAGRDLLRVKVADTGIGIAAVDLARLGEPFEQVESQQAKTVQGTGLGLALVKALTALHGGEFRLESEPGVGTTASFTLLARRHRAAGVEAA